MGGAPVKTVGERQREMSPERKVGFSGRMPRMIYKGLLPLFCGRNKLKKEKTLLTWDSYITPSTSTTNTMKLDAKFCLCPSSFAKWS